MQSCHSFFSFQRSNTVFNYRMARKHDCQQCGATFSKLSELLKHQRLLKHRNKYECNECGKLFYSASNRDRHQQSHNDANHYQCSLCQRVFSRIDNLRRHHAIRHTQKGAGDTEGTTLRMDDLKKNPKKYYTMTKGLERKRRKYNSINTIYKVKIKEIKVEEVSQILQVLGIIFTSMLETMTSTVQQDDLVRVAIHSRDLDFPIQLPFMKKHELTVNLILTEIERVLQSYEEFVLDGTLDIDFFHVKIPSGSGRVIGYANTNHFVKNKRSILQIKNKDNMCCARALVTARARIEEDDRWNSIRQGRKIQERLALELHELADVPVQDCGIEEVKQFQIAMPDYQIFVVSAEHLNAIVYSGPEKEKQIFLFYHDSHFDIITSMPAFLNRSYFCRSCLKGYNTKEEHACNNSCFSCHKIHPAPETGRQLYCKKCNIYFRGEECFALHLKVTDKGNSTCKQYYRCLECGIKINRKLHSKEHHCGEVYCRNCKDFFPPDHQCYMLPVSHSKDDIDSSSSDGHNTGKKDSFDDQEECKIYIYFDFECTQDKVVSCKKGYQPDSETQCCVNCNTASCGSYEHEPNLCIAYKACTYCMDGDISTQSTCEKCGRHENTFSGIDTVNDFCKWLFSKENNGATTFCHNFKGYDSYPILKYLYNNGIIPKVIPNGAKTWQ